MLTADALLIVGFLLVVAGMAWLHIGCGLIVAGAGLMWLGLAWVGGEARNRDPRGRGWGEGGQIARGFDP